MNFTNIYSVGELIDALSHYPDELPVEVVCEQLPYHRSIVEVAQGTRPLISTPVLQLTLDA